MQQLIMYKGSTIRSIANLSPEAMESRRKWDDILKSAKRKKKNSIKNSISGKTFKNKGEIKTFSNKQKLRD